MLAVGLALLLQIYPDAQRYVEAFVSVFVVFLIATGLYHGGKNIGQSVGVVDANPK